MFGVELQDGWTIYIWLLSGAAILVGVVFGIRWAARNEQFDEDIKYLVFDENDKDKMKPEEFAKSQEVNARQEKRRTEVLAEKEAAARAQN
ncbi:MAG: hypothetical protein COW19_08260 [Zetaproteobacteria bacterium CG12_big_fil_rev_8_21_14_0_65_55_1124]|nr:MAG: hypothetical protein AUJ58_03770 [Zetaproteobacteria bacterium CG1_02_55_237]PIS20321.1 MAG: hypothetical protein COT53_00905 [Zetaproteobacteria bacterium CG08_land_8_20_14_0_20_55_17]PIW42452.1 MAG: hypothetical protein COW19_08260 [Zetaproteobacteria bacterium CG12_big_fil_rev_8_21_14_0_65_55_1124]PIY52323.1 MAG: hypothetical protein COZ01_07945 [Zetaproteobacteria bacterium CG_4_10_14_0_8_um_filter_55_43]PIZ37102.1 MAG: hypothetical protein COY36_10045 [Zetaproteobacteria bacterium 